MHKWLIVDSILSMDLTREKLHCAVCGWEWFKRLGTPDPRRCANPACRSGRWKGDPTPGEKLLDPVPEPVPMLEDPEVAAIVEEAVDKLADVVIERGIEKLAAALLGPASTSVLEEIEKDTRGDRLRYEPIEE